MLPAAIEAMSQSKYRLIQFGTMCRVLRLQHMLAKLPFCCTQPPPDVLVVDIVEEEEEEEEEYPMLPSARETLHIYTCIRDMPSL